MDVLRLTLGQCKLVQEKGLLAQLGHERIIEYRLSLQFLWDVSNICGLSDKVCRNLLCLEKRAHRLRLYYNILILETDLQ